MKRRDFLAGSVGTGAMALAGCLGGPDDTATTTTTTSDPYSGTLHVATYEPFVDAPSVSPGSWIKEHFEAEYPDATLEWVTPESGLNHFVQRKRANVTIDADVYVGVNPDDLVRIDQQLDGDGLFDAIDPGTLENSDSVRDDLYFDPQDRAIPFDTGYISLVYDEGVVDEPATFDDLLTDAFADSLLVQNAQDSDPGRAFLLWTIANRGEDAYLEYWDGLLDNGATVLGDWNASYTAYSNEERPMVVSYSTDQVYANRYDEDMQRHQIAFLNDQGYATPEGMARFAGTDVPELATAFVDFMLSAEVQSEIPVLNVMFPATDHADPSADFTDYAYRPPETVMHTYADLEGSLDGWVEAWAQRVAQG
ncbi:MAG: thiamine ABC transporter substrate-binding protein [Halanaeroarchaeum sp.]